MVRDGEMLIVHTAAGRNVRLKPLKRMALEKPTKCKRPRAIGFAAGRVVLFYGGSPMSETGETQAERLATLEKELAQLKDTLPEHCHGADGYISDHRATAEHWQKIEDLEEEIRKLKAELGR